MKTIYLLIATCFTSIVFGQDVRTFYQSPSEEKFSNGLFEYNNDLYFVSLKDSVNSIQKIVWGKLDEQLTTSDYNYQSFIKNENTLHQLSGVGVNGNLLLLAVLRVNTTGTNHISLEYITIDLTTNLIINRMNEAQDFRLGFCTSQNVNGHLISYLSTTDMKLVRLDNNIVGLTNASSEIVEDPLNMSFTPNLKMIDFHVNNGHEYVMCKVGNNLRFFKRESVGVFTQNTINFPAGVTHVNLMIRSNGNIVGSTRNNYVVLDSNLDSLTFGDFDPILNSGWPSNYREMYEKNNVVYDYRFGKASKLDANFQILESYDANIALKPNGSYKSGNDIYLFGESINASQYFKWNGSINIPSNSPVATNFFIVKNEFHNEFSEYNRTINHGNLVYNTGGNGSSFYETTGSPGFKVKFHGKEIATIFRKFNFLVGKKNGNELNGIVDGYSINSANLNGPVISSYDDFNEQMDKYNRGYYVTRQMIEDHLAILFYGNPTYSPPHGIREWPAHGNTNIGESQNLAPFVDVNNNGIYEPMLGDYPEIMGDECTLNIYHQDKDNPTGNSLEVHQYFFTFDCDTSDILKNTLFENVRLINRGDNMDSTFIGTFIDFDLGGPNDDYVGTNVELGMIYTYNGDLFDTNDGGSAGFGDTIAAQGVLVLQGMKQKNDNQDNTIGVIGNESINGVGFQDGIIDNEFYTLESSFYYSNASSYPNNDPEDLSSTWHQLHGRNSDGTTFDYAPGVHSRYKFLGNSDPLFYDAHGYNHANNYSEVTAGITPSDRRMLGSSGPGQYNSGDTINYLTAYIVAIDSNDMSFPPSVNKLFADAAWLKNAFATNNLGCGKSFEPIQSDLSINEVENYDVNVYPNPFKNDIIITNLGDEQSRILLFDLNGNLLLSELSYENKHKINLQLNSGIYILKVENNLGNVVKRIVKY